MSYLRELLFYYLQLLICEKRKMSRPYSPKTLWRYKYIYYDWVDEEMGFVKAPVNKTPTHSFRIQVFYMSWPDYSYAKNIKPTSTHYFSSAKIFLAVT